MQMCNVKKLTVKKLIELLNKLPDDNYVYVNRVGNLSILKEEVYLGYIDFLDETIDLEE